MNEKINPGDLMNGVLGKIYDKLVEGDPDVVTKSPDNHFAWLSVPIPFHKSDFDFMNEGFKGYARQPIFSPLNNTMTSVEKTKNTNEENSDGESNEDNQSSNISESSENEMSKEDLIAIDANRKYLQAENIAALLDYIPDVDGMNSSTINVFSSEGKISSVYHEVLNHCMVADYEMDEKTKAKVEKYKSKMVTKEYDDILEKEVEKPSKMVLLYEQKKNAYDAACQEYNDSVAEAIVGTNENNIHAMSTGNAKVLQSKKDAALRDWISNGYKEQYEHITNFISHVEGRHMVSLIDKYKQDFENAQVSAMSGSKLPFQYTSLVPGTFAKTSSWTQFEYTFSDYKSKYKNKSQTIGGSAGGGTFLGGASVEASHTKTNAKRESDFEGFYLKFQICAVQIYRPWFHKTFLTNTSWKFDSNDVNYKDDLLSDGNIPAKGRMPAVTTQCIFIRDLRLNYGKYHSEFEKNLSETDVSVKTRSIFHKSEFNYNNSESSGNRERNRTSNEIKVDGMQLIGFKCHLLKESPNPNPEIEKWV
ncbi:hypothetical protein [uncultured Winogradskyella sp.]|uniref:hypothetical protein n=1 Tax=uncultured Winogradskyella sp. TaxID=395353 RepID=UPI0026377173|nr:hypothetical protein [uncultured Winogradskyella sp.]